MIFLPAFFTCRKPYQPAVVNKDYNYLVIDGVINATVGGITSITLSRTRNLNDSIIAPKPELSAQIVIETEGGTNYTLLAQGNGVYNSPALNLNPLSKYRLRITTFNGGVYQSDYVSVKQTPPIDSVTWKQRLDSPNKAVTIFVHSHDPQNKTLFYRWDYLETWQYEAPLNGSLGLDSRGQIFYTDATTQTFNCWSTAGSRNISTASSESLAQDVISYAPVSIVPQNDERMAVRYSINVKQYGLTKEAYNYWEIIKKSSQQSGSIFDPQPAQVIGNIHCISNADEPVIGYVSVSYITEKRKFIDKNELTDWHFPNSPGNRCVPDTVPAIPNNFQVFTYADTTYGPYYFITTPALYLIVARKICLDCRRKGGTNSKPAFW
ncbi:MAG: hypothetical protein JWQ30_2253 [Sediminibacterium sp.]|nr:hypothetical protein [Sediminibacterium sp.]